MYHDNRRGCYGIVLLAIVMAIIGIVMQYSASMYSATKDMGDEFYYVKKQSVALVFSIISMLFFSHFRVEILRKYRYYILIASYILLALVFVPGLGVEKYGARRWINLGVVTVQPSEIAKVALVIFIAGELSLKDGRTLKGMLPSLIALGGMCVLIMLEPNMSITMCVSIVALILLFVGGAKAKHFVMLCAPLVVAVPLLIMLEPYRLKRLIAFMDPWASPKGEGYQLIQSYYALGSGGMFGVGLFHSRQKYLFLPFAESDFIFSVIGEETGLLGSLLVVAMFLALIGYGIVTAVRAKTRFESYLSAGISILIAVQSALNIAVVSGAVPPTGLPLPLISHGGSSLVVYMSALGMVRSIAMRTNASILHTM